MTFLLWISMAAASDVVYRKCFNWLVISGFILWLIFLWINPELFNLKVSLGGRIIGGFGAFLIFLIFYFLGMMGAGDVKFAAVLGLWTGWELFLPIWALSCFFSVIHGLLVRGDFLFLYFPFIKLGGVKKNSGRKFIPYVSYLSIATVIVLMTNQ